MRDTLQFRLLRYNIGEELATLTWNPVDRGRGVFVNRFRNLMTDAVAAGDTSLMPVGEDWSSALASSLAEAVRILTHQLGSDMDTWRWDRVHRVRPQHPLAMAHPELAPLLNPPEIPTGGDGDTPWAGSYSPADLATIGGLSVFRYAYDLGDWERSLWAVPLGASGHPASEHYADQSATWGRVQMTKMRYDWNAIKAAAKTAQTLRVG
jgi:penicillin amidase